MSMTYTAPVPKDADTKQAYGNRPVASGPYKIENYELGTALSLVRNGNWDPATDPNRPAYPDRFQFELNADRAAASERLIKSAGNDAFAVPLDGILEQSDLWQSAGTRSRASVRQRAGPMCRLHHDEHATHQGSRCPACDRTRHRQAGYPIRYGGDVYGTIADSVIPPDVPGYAPADLALKPGGDPEAAKKLLEGKSVPPIHMAVNDQAGPARSKEITLIETNLKAVGLEVVVDPYSDDDLPPSSMGLRVGTSTLPEDGVSTGPQRHRWSCP